ncbi:MAG: hypothetical protein ACUVT3_07390 [Ignavibacterium sp.]
MKIIKSYHHNNKAESDKADDTNNEIRKMHLREKIMTIAIYLLIVLTTVAIMLIAIIILMNK